MDRNDTPLLYLRQKFPLLSDAKIREGVYTGPDIRSLLRNEVFERIITGDEQRAWHACMVADFLGNRSPSMLADYCWILMRDSPNSTFNRQAKKALLH